MARVLDLLMAKEETGSTPAPVNPPVNPSSVNSSTFTIDSGIQTGDLMVLLDAATMISTSGLVVPSGFTMVSDNLETTNPRFVSSYKILTAADAGTTLTGMTGSVASRKILLYFRFATPVTSVSAGGVFNQVAGSTSMSATVIPSSAGTGSVIAIAGYRVYTAPTLSGQTTFTPAPGALPSGSFEFDAGGSGYFLASFKTFTGSPVDVTTSVIGPVDTTLTVQGFYLSVS